MEVLKKIKSVFWEEEQNQEEDKDPEWLPVKRGVNFYWVLEETEAAYHMTILKYDIERSRETGEYRLRKISEPEPEVDEWFFKDMVPHRLNTNEHFDDYYYPLKKINYHTSTGGTMHVRPINMFEDIDKEYISDSNFPDFIYGEEITQHLDKHLEKRTET